MAVTGGAGFIGSHLADALVALGADVTLLDDLSNGRAANLAGDAGRARFVRGSILDAAALDEALAGAELVFHQAARGSVPQSIEAPLDYLETNYEDIQRDMDECSTTITPKEGERRKRHELSRSATKAVCMHNVTVKVSFN